MSGRQHAGCPGLSNATLPSDDTVLQDHDGKLSYTRVSGTVAMVMAVLLVLANTFAHFKGLGPIPNSDTWIMFFTGGSTAFGALAKVPPRRNTVTTTETTVVNNGTTAVSTETTTAAPHTTGG